MGQAVRRGAWGVRITHLALILSLGGVAAALIASVGSGQGAWHFRTGFTVLRYALFAAVAGGVLALVGLVIARRSRSGKLTGLSLLALIVGLGFVLYLGAQIRTARTVPAIHDITTNLSDVPQFIALTVRADNLENIPDNEDPRLKALDPESRWKEVHRAGYPDLRTVSVPWPPAETVRRAEALARARGWEVAKADPQAGILEATDTTRFFRFKDDVVIRVRPNPSGTGSNVDMRSISRVGVSDVGMNAKRVRSFLADLQKS